MPLTAHTLPYQKAQRREEGKGALQQASLASAGSTSAPPLQVRGQERSNKHPLTPQLFWTLLRGYYMHLH